MYHLNSVSHILLAHFSMAGNVKSTKPSTLMVYVRLKTS